MNVELLKQVGTVAVAGSIFTTTAMQQIKSGINFKKSKILVWVSLVVSMLLGTAFALCFSDLSIIYSLWAGFTTWLGAEAIYTALEDKIFKPYSKMQEDKKTKAVVLEREENK
jgi:multidrug transporter EmrE-like cation transporter